MFFLIYWLKVRKMTVQKETWLAPMKREVIGLLFTVLILIAWCSWWYQKIITRLLIVHVIHQDLSNAETSLFSAGGQLIPSSSRISFRNWFRRDQRLFIVMEPYWIILVRVVSKPFQNFKNVHGAKVTKQNKMDSKANQMFLAIFFRKC